MSANQVNYARRTHRRIVDLPCQVVHEHGDEPIGYSLRDVSLHGAWVRTSFPASVGETLALCFEPQGWEGERELIVFATVERVLKPQRGLRKRGMALQFLDITRDEQLALQRCLSGLPLAGVLTPPPPPSMFN